MITRSEHHAAAFSISGIVTIPQREGGADIRRFFSAQFITRKYREGNVFARFQPSTFFHSRCFVSLVTA